MAHASLLLPITVWAALSLAVSAPAQTRTLTLDQVLGEIENANLTVLTNREFIGQAEERARLVRAGLLPRVEVGVSQSRADRGAASAAGRISNTFEAGLFGSATLLDFQQFATLRAARAAVRVSEHDYRAAVQTALAAVAARYFDHRRAVAFDAVIESNIERARVLLELARNQLQAGVATQIDVTRAEAELVTEQQAKLQQETEVLDSALRLKRLLNLDPALALALDDFLVRRDLDPAIRGLTLDAVLERRPDFLAASAAVEQTRLEVRAAVRERLPVVSGFAQGGVNSDYLFDGEEQKFWGAGVELSMPVFDGARIRANERIAASRLRQQEFRLQDLRQSIDSEWRIALQDVQSQIAQIAVAEKNRALAEDEVRLARVRYEQGVADNRELIDAQNRLTASNFNLVNAVYSYHVARVELARARGEVRLILEERTP